jgi:mRNA-degrading endonuclease toxin of MazEF toxin-antitoxin module
MMKTRRGDFVLMLFPNTDLRTAKRRPALVIQRDNLGGGLPQTIVAMVSSNLARAGENSTRRLPGSRIIEAAAKNALLIMVRHRMWASYSPIADLGTLSSRHPGRR